MNVAATVCLSCAAVLSGGPAGARPASDRAIASLLQTASVRAALEQIKTQDALTFQEQVQLSQIPAPSFDESLRAADYLRRIRALGLSEAAIDREGNVIARRAGAGGGPTLVLSAHLDTVFPKGTDVTVHEKNGRFYGRGLADDARGLAVVLAVLRAMQGQKIATRGDVMFVGTVGEEGLGNLRGAKALFRDNPGIDGFISVDHVDRQDAKYRFGISSRATGSRRWSLRFTGPGGHSYLDFGAPSAVHAMGRAIASIAELRVPADPKTTFTVGVASGGSAVNAIAGEAEMRVDLRSEQAAALAALEAEMLAAADQAVKAENARWSSNAIRVEKKLLGDRPAGATGDDTAVVVAAQRAITALGLPLPRLAAASTDSNVPLALGVPAATLTGGGEADNTHSSEEWYRPVDAWLGPQAVLLTTLALVGVNGVSAPTLPEAMARPQTAD